MKAASVRANHDAPAGGAVSCAKLSDDANLLYWVDFRTTPRF